MTPPFLKNNVDFSLLRCRPEELTRATRNTADLYIALGELKGGIDPARADEHWKTARTALSRIRDAFSSRHLSPRTFAVIAAIAKKMADEIWAQLEDGILTNAANLTSPDQVTSLCRWLANL